MYFYLVNPAAGKGRLRSIETKLTEGLKKHDILGEWVKTTGRGDIKTLLRRSKERSFGTIVAVGGDGIVDELINDLDDPQTAIGIIPTGSTNRIAELAGIRNYKDAIRVLAARRIETVKTALAEGGGPARQWLDELSATCKDPLTIEIDGYFAVSGQFKSLKVKHDLLRHNLRLELADHSGAHTSLPATRVEFSKAITGVLDNEPIEGKLKLSLTDRVLRIIVSKDRQFGTL